MMLLSPVMRMVLLQGWTNIYKMKKLAYTEWSQKLEQKSNFWRPIFL